MFFKKLVFINIMAVLLITVGLIKGASRPSVISLQGNVSVSGLVATGGAAIAISGGNVSYRHGTGDACHSNVSGTGTLVVEGRNVTLDNVTQFAERAVLVANGGEMTVRNMNVPCRTELHSHAPGTCVTVFNSALSDVLTNGVTTTFENSIVKSVAVVNRPGTHQSVVLKRGTLVQGDIRFEGLGYVTVEAGSGFSGTTNALNNAELRPFSPAELAAFHARRPTAGVPGNSNVVFSQLFGRNVVMAAGIAGAAFLMYKAYGWFNKKN